MPHARPVLICTSAYTCDTLNAFRRHVSLRFIIVRDRSSFQCDRARYVDRTVDLKYIYALALARYGGYRVLLADTDMAVLSDPLEYLLAPVAGSTSLPDLMCMSDAGMATLFSWSCSRPLYLWLLIALLQLIPTHVLAAAAQ